MTEGAALTNASLSALGARVKAMMPGEDKTEPPKRPKKLDPASRLSALMKDQEKKDSESDDNLK